MSSTAITSPTQKVHDDNHRDRALPARRDGDGSIILAARCRSLQEHAEGGGVAEQNRPSSEQVTTLHTIVRQLEGRINDLEDRN